MVSSTPSLPGAPPSVSAPAAASVGFELPGQFKRRGATPRPSGYAVFDCETTGVRPGVDEIVSLALVLLDPDGARTGELSSLVRPSRPIPAEANAVHGLRDEDVADAPSFAELAEELLTVLDGQVFVAHNTDFDLEMLRHAFRRAGLDYRPAGVACTLQAFRLLEPLADSHRLVAICERHGITLTDAHHAGSDVLAASALVQLLLAMNIAPESVAFDPEAFMRLRSCGDTRPASEAQVRRVFALARAAGLTEPSGRTDRGRVSALIFEVAGIDEPDRLNREQVQSVYQALEHLIAAGRQPVVAGGR
jgi:DNA polymerase III epsilon subunit family exonuclease